jgi:hypothetical protein
MKISLLLAGCLIAPWVCLSQVGIGTTSPNFKSVLDLSSTEKGLLIPRMTWQQKTDLALNSNDAGMMVYQTDQPGVPNNFIKGLYFFDGNNWVAPVLNGASNGQTLRWDGIKWVATSNLFNQGSSIGIGTTNPKHQVHIHSSGAPYTRLQITNAYTEALTDDGLVLGLSLSNGHGHLMQQENRPLFFGTNKTERMRIDSVGNVGIGVTNPSAKLDVNGTVRIGSTGSLLHSIIKTDMEIMVPIMAADEESIVNIACPNALEDAVVYISPDAPLSGLMIGYARVSDPDMLEVKFMNMGPAMTEPLTLMLHIAVIQ